MKNVSVNFAKFPPERVRMVYTGLGYLGYDMSLNWVTEHRLLSSLCCL